jgi:hypothetical protein
VALVAAKRASLIGRGPILADVHVAMDLFGCVRRRSSIATIEARFAGLAHSYVRSAASSTPSTPINSSPRRRAATPTQRSAMSFDLTDEQRAFRDVMRSFVDGASRPTPRATTAIRSTPRRASTPA